MGIVHRPGDGPFERAYRATLYDALSTPTSQVRRRPASRQAYGSPAAALELLYLYGTITAAASAAGVPRRTFRALLDDAGMPHLQRGRMRRPEPLPIADRILDAARSRR